MDTDSLIVLLSQDLGLWHIRCLDQHSQQSSHVSQVHMIDKNDTVQIGNGKEEDNPYFGNGWIQHPRWKLAATEPNLQLKVLQLLLETSTIN